VNVGCYCQPLSASDYISMMVSTFGEYAGSLRFLTAFCFTNLSSPSAGLSPTLCALQIYLLTYLLTVKMAFTDFSSSSVLFFYVLVLLFVNFYRAMHFSAYARSWDRMSSVCPSVRPSVCNVGGL